VVMIRWCQFFRTTLTLFLLIFFLPVTGSTRAGSNQTKREVHAVWAHPPAVGNTVESVRKFVDQCKRANIDTVVILIKGAQGEIYWQSKRFPQAIAKGYEGFDFLGTLVKEAHAKGIKIDAWFCDFIEGPRGAAYREHPEWAQLNPDGTTTASEKLGHTKPYDYVWMCPARRPGYVDQWLIPMFEEVAKNYDVDSVHHDYVRYPGDVAPDSYCFCDYCLAHIPQYAMLSYKTRSDERYRVKFAQPRIEANWWSDPTMVPADWDRMDRREKADFLLNGRTIPGGPPDMRYFFYDYRQYQIKEYVRELATHIRGLDRKIEISAAVFKNPILSGRFIGQHWNNWTQWIDVFMPMTYRSHFAGSFDSYLDHLTETTAQQLEWVNHERPVYAGVATTYLYREELQPIDDIRERANEMKGLPVDDSKARAEKARAIKTSFEAMSTHLAEVAPQTEKEIGTLIDAVVANDGRGATSTAIEQLIARMSKLRSDLPPGYFPPEKLLQAIDAARKAHPDGIVIFSAGNLNIEKLWPALETSFKR
ncbi:MAG TPA: family 10 glycosylhydrolase, partial [Pyrinomonadaceae bacterium]